MAGTQASNDAPAWVPWVSVASVAVAGTALVLGFFNRRTAVRALRIAEKQEDRRIPKLDLSLQEALGWRPPQGGIRSIAAQLLAVNASDRDGSITRVELEVTYATKEGNVLGLRLPHQNRPVHAFPGVTAAQVPITLKGNDSTAGWFVFEIADEVLLGQPVNRFTIIVTDSRGIQASVTTSAVREIVDGPG